MAIKHVALEPSGNGTSSASLPLYVYDDGDPPAAVSFDDVVTYLNAHYGGTIPSTYYGLEDDGDPTYKQRTRSSWEVTIKYRTPTLRPLHPVAVGTARRSRFQFTAPRKFYNWAPEIAKYPGTSLTMGGVINVVQDFESGAFTSGVWIDPPPVSFVTEESFAPSSIDAAWIRTLAKVIQACAVNSDPLVSGAYAAGELMIGHCSGHQVSPKAFLIETGWCWIENVTGETRDTITGIAYQGHDFVWNLYQQYVDRDHTQLGQQIKTVYVNRPRPRVAFAGLGISPP